VPLNYGDYQVTFDQAKANLTKKTKIKGRDYEIWMFKDLYLKSKITRKLDSHLLKAPFGAGKTTLLNELYEQFLSLGGTPIYIEIHPKESSSSYNCYLEGITQVFNRILLSERNVLAQWKEVIRQVVGPNSDLLIEIIPQSKFLLRDPLLRNSEMQLPPNESRNRIIRLILDIYNLLVDQFGGLILILDNTEELTNSDSDLLSLLVESLKEKPLFLILSENQDTVALSRESNVFPLRVNQLFNLEEHILPDLDFYNLVEITSEILQKPAEEVTEVTRKLVGLTGTNPLYFMEALDYIKETDSIDDIYKISEIEVSKQRAVAISSKLDRLGMEHIEFLKFISCCERGFNLEDLYAFYNEGQIKIDNFLKSSYKEKLLLQNNNFVRFSHKHIADTIYSKLQETDRKEYHYRLAKYFLAKIISVERDFNNIDLMEAAFQFSRSVDKLKNLPKYTKAAEIMLGASKLLITKTDYRGANEILHHLLILFNDSDWIYNNEICFTAHYRKMQCEYFLANPQSADALADLVLSKQPNPYQRSQIVCLRINILVTLGKMTDALALATSELLTLNIDLPGQPSNQEVLSKINEVVQNPIAKNLSKFLNENIQPEKVDSRIRAAIKILEATLLPAHFSGEHLVRYIATEMVQLSLKYGITEESPIGFVWFGLILTDRSIGRYYLGYNFGKLASDLIEKMSLIHLEVVVAVLFGDIINFYKNHFITDRIYLTKGYQSGIAFGNLNYASYCTNHLITNSLIIGDPLDKVSVELESYLKFVRQIGNTDIEYVLLAQKMFIRSLRQGLQEDFAAADDNPEFINFEERIAKSQMSLMKLWYYILKMTSQYMFGDIKRAKISFDLATELIWADPWNSESVNYYFFGALVLAEVFEKASEDDKPALLETIKAHDKQLTIWSSHCPENFYSRSIILKGELARIQNEKNLALAYYDEAIISSKRYKFIPTEALCFELLSKFLKKSNSGDFLKSFAVQQSIKAYQEWGATAKVSQLENTNYDISEFVSNAMPNSIQDQNVIQLLEVSQYLSSQFEPSTIIEYLLKFLINKFNVARSLLCFLKEGEFYILGEGLNRINAKTIQYCNKKLDEVNLSHFVANYVINTLTMVSFSKTNIPNLFLPDPYFKTSEVFSLICLPLIRSNRCFGFIYLETNQLQKTIDNSALSIINWLSNQTVISLENAFLFEKQNAEAEIRQRLIDEAENALKVKTQFLANMSHEIRTPMNSILGMADLLAETQLNPEQTKYVEIFKKTGTALLNIINDILDLSKIEAGSIKLEYINFDIRELADRLKDVINLRATQKNIEFKMRLDPALPATLNGDPTRLYQILSNLLLNSIKFTGKGMVSFDIVREEIRNSIAIIRFEIVDTGIGIPQDILPNLFKAFQQADSSTTRQFGGTGLGLAIVKNLTDLMSGSVEVYSKEGSWTRFIVKISFLIAEERIMQKTEVIDYKALIPKTRLLLVDDADDNRLLIKAYLKSFPQITITERVNGQDALVTVTSGEVFDLIFMDMQMPVMDGYESTRKIREWESKENTSQRNKIIALTAHAMAEEKEKTKRAGCDIHMSKPVKKIEILKLIYSIMVSNIL
jgi:signal transduction histidine kinase/CheY-like chemotaxis protein